MSQLQLRIGPQSAVAGASILESEIVYAFDSETFWSANEAGAKINLNPISVWKPAVLRIVGCVVERNGILFRCTTQHTSSASFETDAANWTLVTKPPVRVVTNIANRDLITGFNLFEGLGCYVLDATGDVTVTTGAAFYVYTGTAWDKLSEFESLDVTIDDASETAKGILELATATEFATGTDTVRAVTPAQARNVKRRLVSSSDSTDGATPAPILFKPTDMLLELDMTAMDRIVELPTGVPEGFTAEIILGTEGNTLTIRCNSADYLTADGLTLTAEGTTFKAMYDGTGVWYPFNNIHTLNQLRSDLDLKASSSDMTTALGLKADTSTMTTALGLKANASDVGDKTTLTTTVKTSTVEAINELNSSKASAASVAALGIPDGTSIHVAAPVNATVLTYGPNLTNNTNNFNIGCSIDGDIAIVMSDVTEGDGGMSGRIKVGAGDFFGMAFVTPRTIRRVRLQAKLQLGTAYFVYGDSGTGPWTRIGSPLSITATATNFNLPHSGSHTHWGIEYVTSSPGGEILMSQYAMYEGATFDASLELRVRDDGITASKINALGIAAIRAKIDVYSKSESDASLALKADNFTVGTRTSLFDFDASSASYLSLNWMLAAQGGTYFADGTFNGGNGLSAMDGSQVSISQPYCNGKFGREFSTPVDLAKFIIRVGTGGSRMKDFSIYVKTGGLWYISNDPVLNGNFNFSITGGTDMGNAVYRVDDSDTAVTTLSCGNSVDYQGYAIRPISGYPNNTTAYLYEFEAYQIDLAAVPSPNTNCVNSINNVYGKLVNLPARTDSSVAVTVLASDRLVRINATGAGASQTVTLPLISSVANGKIITLTGIGTSTYPAAINPGSGNTILGGNITFNENGQSATLVANLVNSQWEVISHSKPSVINAAVKNNYAGTAAPTASNDQTQGYAPGSVWLDATSTPKETYRCAVASTGAAIWLKTSLTYDELPSSRAVTSHSSASGNITYPTSTKMLVITMIGSSNVQVTLGASAGYPDEIKIKRLGSGTGVITILPNGVETIDGVAGLFAANPYVGSSGDLLAMEPVTSGFILA